MVWCVERKGSRRPLLLLLYEQILQIEAPLSKQNDLPQFTTRFEKILLITNPLLNQTADQHILTGNEATSQCSSTLKGLSTISRMMELSLQECSAFQTQPFNCNWYLPIWSLSCRNSQELIYHCLSTLHPNPGYNMPQQMVPLLTTSIWIRIARSTSMVM